MVNSLQTSITLLLTLYSWYIYPFKKPEHTSTGSQNTVTELFVRIGGCLLGLTISVGTVKVYNKYIKRYIWIISKLLPTNILNKTNSPTHKKKENQIKSNWAHSRVFRGIEYVPIDRYGRNKVSNNLVSMFLKYYFDIVVVVKSICEHIQRW